jgi:hypothetical protein
MEKRIRSPNYPAISLPDALERVAAVYRALHTHAGPREVIAKGMGFNTLNGASATAISALHKYGLLEKNGDDIKVSERALRILHPHSPEEKAEAIREAATAPQLFAELAERFPGRLPNEELLRNYLVRNGFAPAAAQIVVLAYRETSELVERSAGGHDSGSLETPETVMQASPLTTKSPVIGAPSLSSNIGNERQIGLVDLEGGGYVRIVSLGEIDTEEALEWAEDIIARKRRELKRKGRPSPAPETNDDVGKNSDA